MSMVRRTVCLWGKIYKFLGEEIWHCRFGDHSVIILKGSRRIYNFEGNINFISPPKVVERGYDMESKLWQIKYRLD